MISALASVTSATTHSKLKIFLYRSLILIPLLDFQKSHLDYNCENSKMQNNSTCVEKSCFIVDHSQVCFMNVL